MITGPSHSAPDCYEALQLKERVRSKPFQAELYYFKNITPFIQKVNWTYIKRSINCSGVWNFFRSLHNIFKELQSSIIKCQLLFLLYWQSGLKVKTKWIQYTFFDTNMSDWKRQNQPPDVVFERSPKYHFLNFLISKWDLNLLFSEAVVQWCSVQKVFLEISQNS